MTEPPPPPPHPPRAGDRPGPDRTGRLLVAGGVLLVVAGLVVGLVWWLGGDDEEASGPDYAADCRTIEDEAPELGDELPVLMNIGLDRGTRVEAAHSAADQFQSIADQLSDREFAEDMTKAADAMHEAGDALERQDLQTAFTHLRTLTGFLQPFVAWLDEHCERWLGPGQWGEPGATPTGIPGAPTDIPTGLPSLPSLPSFPSEFPSLPPLPGAPSSP